MISRRPPLRHRVRVKPIAGEELWRMLPPLPKPGMLDNELAQYRRAYIIALWYAQAGERRGIPNQYGGKTILYQDVIGHVVLGVN